MLQTEHVLARRRGDRLELGKLTRRKLERIAELGAELLSIYEQGAGESREALDAQLDEVEFEPAEKRIVAGLRKLLDDRSTFGSPADSTDGPTPIELRQHVFTAAAAARARLEPGSAFDRESVLESVASTLQLAPDRVEHVLFADLKQAQCLLEFEPIGPETLARKFADGQRQAVLLRATHVVIELLARDSAATRALFHKLKFLRLLYRIEACTFATENEEDPSRPGFRLTIDGPHSLFQAVTKYGLQLAMLVPTLDQMTHWRLRARVRWGVDKQPLDVAFQGPRRGRSELEPPPLSDDIATLVAQFDKLGSRFAVRRAETMLDLPGVGLCVPDLTFEDAVTGATVHLEVMGYWSRDAVWRRVELVEAGLPHKVLFAVSERLRVSEAVLDADLPGALYVYKGVMSARRILERLQEMIR